MILPRQFKNARLMNELKIKDAAEKLGISQSTLSEIENGVKSTTLDNLEKMADLYGVTTDYLLGRNQKQIIHREEPISKMLLPSMHGNPVWSEKYGWMMVDAINNRLIIDSKTSMTFENAGELFAVIPSFAIPETPTGEPILKKNLSQYGEVWVEPISTDAKFREELRGWYDIKKLWAENEFGNKFYLNTYGAKWLAFTSNL